jgi:hypothetical protein
VVRFVLQIYRLGAAIDIPGWHIGTRSDYRLVAEYNLPLVRFFRERQDIPDKAAHCRSSSAAHAGGHSFNLAVVRNFLCHSGKNKP